METFRFRLGFVDYYQAEPSHLDPPLPLAYSALPYSRRPRVPVLRVFGSTDTGQKVCAHVHGAFPYIYIDYDGGLNSLDVAAAQRSLHRSIDNTLASSFHRESRDRPVAFVAHISLVKGVPFYGYHVGYRLFFKIYLFNPSYTLRLAELLRRGAILGRRFQPYESHLQYRSQWMIDYNLYGCSFINCKKALFRQPLPAYDRSDSKPRWTDRSVPSNWISDSASSPRQSYCELEVDVHVQDILNRHEINERYLHHALDEHITAASLDEKLVPSLASLWQEEAKRRRDLAAGIPTVSPFSTSDLVPMSIGQRSHAGGKWIHEDDYRGQLHKRIAEGLKHLNHGSVVSFKDTVRSTPFLDSVDTIFASVADLYPEKVSSQSSSYDLHTTDSEDLQREGDQAELLPSWALDQSHKAGEEVEGTMGTFVAEHLFDQESDSDDQGPEYTQHEVSNKPLRHDHVPHLTDQASESHPRGVSSTTHSSHCWSSSSVPSYPSQDRVTTQELKDIGIYSMDEPVDYLDHFYESYYGRTDDGSKPYGLDSSDHLTDSTPPKYPWESTQQTKVASSRQPKDGKIPFSVSKGVQSPAKAPERGLREIPPSESVSSGSHSQPQYDHHGVPPYGSTQQSQSSLLDPSSNINSVYARSLRQSFASAKYERSMVYMHRLPSKDEILATIGDDAQPSVIYQDPFYSNEDDVPNYRREYAGKDLCRETQSIYNLPFFELAGPPDCEKREIRFDPRFNDKLEEAGRKMRKQCSIRVWEFMPTLPTRAEVARFFQMPISPAQHVTQKAMGKRAARCPKLSEISFDSCSRQLPGEFDRLQSFCSQGDMVMSLEVHVNTRQHFVPDPKEDEIQCIFLAIQSIDTLEENDDMLLVVISLRNKVQRSLLPKMTYVLFEEDTELDLINKLVDVVRFVDPEILIGYEIHGGSWGYIIERSRELYDYSLCDEISRVRSQAQGSFGRENDRWGFEHSCSVRITGRNIINIWRAMRSELTLLQYTMENVVFHLFKQRIPHYHFQDLTSWFNSDIPRHKAITVEYFANRVCLDLKILAANETISRTQEQARILGIDFASVILRGSQFKVESLMFRIAKPESYMLVSPSKEQVGQENALECQPLIMEPQSAFYTSPVLVLDFQSLYPSVVIAHNYCYSTCLGRVTPWRGRNKIGFLNLDVDDRLIALLEAHVDIAPNGILYAKRNVRQSLLARMLAEILETRVMVKNSMKEHKDDKTMQRLLNNRQLALKYIANVTYGYTSAAFSGRMPCVEIADSIVSTGREILEKAIAMIHSVERWGAEVVYGDTDSLFIHLKGRTREEAFAIGEEIAEAVTNANPRPIKLKFEKVYHPCLLQSKKRYVGYKYESLGQKEPVFDAKGIETIRRDGTPLQQATVDKVLRILFETSDLSLIKEYFQERCADIIRGDLPVGDFTFAKEVKLGKYKSEGTAPPGALVSAQRMIGDRRLEPQYGERVPYVVITGEPGTNLALRCVSPETFLSNPGMTLDAHYYISKNLIPSLSRILNLAGADVSRWYYDMPKVRLPQKFITDRSIRNAAIGNARTQEGIDFGESAPSFRSFACIVCQSELNSGEEKHNICQICWSRRHQSLLRLNIRMRDMERQTVQLQAISRSIMGVPFGDNTRCDNKDSPLFYARMKAEQRLNTLHAQLEAAMNHLGSATEERLEW